MGVGVVGLRRAKGCSVAEMFDRAEFGANPEQPTISLSFVTGKPVLRLYERFGFKVVEEQPGAVVMHREV